MHNSLNTTGTNIRGRTDATDFINKEIIELKPGTPSGIKAGDAAKVKYEGALQDVFGPGMDGWIVTIKYY